MSKKSFRVTESFYLIWIILFLLFFIGSSVLIDEIKFIYSYFLSANLSAFCLVLVDKLFAQSNARRIPENLLYLSILFGGTIGAIIGMILVRHKTRKTLFQIIVSLILLVQIGLFIYLQ